MWISSLTRALVAVALLSFVSPGPAAAQAPQGFGASTPGGAGQSVYHVTNRNDSGPGSLRDAVAASRRHIVFDVAGDIALASPIYVKGAYLTIDGTSAPSPGITLRNHGLYLHGSNGAHDVILRGLRVRQSSNDGIRVAYGAYNVLIEHVSVHGALDGSLDVTESAHDVTVAWSILAQPQDSQKNMLIKYNASRVTLPHNLFVNAAQRNPYVAMHDPGAAITATTTTLDMRQNLVWNWGTGIGTKILDGPRANVVNNYYGSAGGDSGDALVVCDGSVPVVHDGDCSIANPANPARAYVAGNISAASPGFDINSVGNVSAPFTAPAVDAEDACTAASRVVAEAGVRPLDTIDRQQVDGISLGSCPSAPLTVTVVSPTAGATVSGNTAVSLSASGGTSYSYVVTLDGARLWAGTTPSFTWNTTTTTNGGHTLGVTVTDALGRTASHARSVTVQNAATASMTASFTAPPEGATLSGTTTVRMAAAGATVLPVTFTLAIDGRTVSTQTVSGTAAQHRLHTRKLSNGPHTLTLTVKDAAGHTATATRSITVAN